VFLGLFIFACKVVALGRAFSRRLINEKKNKTKQKPKKKQNKV
jgi:Na+-transporting methylmalonyl-CoA/oxaloacetate decarboxylase gamma subunit